MLGVQTWIWIANIILYTRQGVFEKHFPKDQSQQNIVDTYCGRLRSQDMQEWASEVRASPLAL